MQDFISQAAKNNIVLHDKGTCQFCGAHYQKGIFDCMENYSKGLEFSDLIGSENQHAIFFSVDAHALQHPEIHGRWSNHFHLTRLYLIFEKNITWTYQKSALLSAYLKSYKAEHPNELLNPPKSLERGKITSKDWSEALTITERVDLSQKWAFEVFNSWNSNHSVVRKIAEGILKLNFH